MIARDLRLRSEADFERVRSQGRSLHARLVIAVVLPNELGQNRYGFAAGKRIGKAVRRNRAKRLLREAARLLHPRLAPGHDVIFIARNSMAPETMLGDVLPEVERLMQRAGLLRELEQPQEPAHESPASRDWP